MPRSGTTSSGKGSSANPSGSKRTDRKEQKQRERELNSAVSSLLRFTDRRHKMLDHRDLVQKSKRDDWSIKDQKSAMSDLEYSVGKYNRQLSKSHALITNVTKTDSERQTLLAATDKATKLNIQDLQSAMDRAIDGKTVTADGLLEAQVRTEEALAACHW